MHAADLQWLLRILMPVSWIAIVLAALFIGRDRRAHALGLQAVVFFGSAFVTRLAIDHHESRWQMACFAFAAAVLEVLRIDRKTRGARLTFWLVASIASIIGIVLARPIAHRYDISTW